MTAITYAAVKHGESVYVMPRPCRHHHILHKHRLPQDAIQGFVDSEGSFLTRTQAFHVAKAAGQLKPQRPGHYKGALLFSEDIW